MNKVFLSIPGKILLGGEYSILTAGSKGLACALDLKLEMEIGLTPNRRQSLKVSTPFWPEPWIGTAKEGMGRPEFLIKLFAMAISQNPFLSKGATLEVLKPLDQSAGIGSSSALALGVWAGCGAFVSQDLSWARRKAWEFQHQQQSCGASGYDILVQSLGGMVAFSLDPKNWPGDWTQIPWTESFWKKQISFFFKPKGGGAPTGPLMKKQNYFFNRFPQIKKDFDHTNTSLVESLIDYLTEKKPFDLGFFSLVKTHRNLLSQSPSYTDDIHRQLSTNPDLDQTWSYKTTGAGGLDTLLIFGQAKEPRSLLEASGWQELPQTLSPSGISMKAHP